ncbi:RsmB/NOP family class I SAM-dependent RNA methyltransferase [Dokdonia sp. Hel_I_53]|uniref:RsmB/NOP family class I SAM-dependent RNA methyltransferase n=1 Tax=Dokdonia sp. Hel_I_53 TaxID=1566287 RepID=UPI00119977A3|nr:methyltransferase domain-containing protein [Dokdonia sp. Hel_I_53]TVZ51445.1 16S rRNA (cytosine967-C5)-methyltransferase [Dokdonia sp. Hel_I_53]
MKLHRNLVFAAVDALGMIFNDSEQADKVLRKVLKFDKRWGSRDRGFIAETVYDIVRWKRLYSEIAEVKAPYSRPNLFRLFAVWATLRRIEVPDWKQMEPIPSRRIKGRFDELSKIRKYRESIPDWLDELGEKALGKKWDAEMAALNTQAQVVLRANTLKASVKEVRNTLADQDVDTKILDGYPDALELMERKNVFTSEAFKNGYFEVQDASSQRVARYADVKPGMRVVDTCAGAGGKSLHLAALMENKGQIIAMDIYEGKLKELKRRAKRAGAHNIETREIDSTKVYKKLYNTADRVVIDAPCSGLGTIKRNPDLKWKLQPDFLEKVIQRQAEILNNYSKIVKENGKLLYATCSILPRENQEQVQAFLATEQGQKFILDKEETISPAKTGYDGFYMALLSRKQ